MSEAVDRERPTAFGSDRVGDSESARYLDPVVEVYKRDVDRTLLRENLKLTPEERLIKLERVVEYLLELRAAGRKLREGQ
jgi:hypothetical protein